MSDSQTSTSQIVALIAKGKEQGYLTNAEVNDALPESITESEQIEDIIQMLTDVGIPVHERAPETDELMLESTPEAGDDEVAAEEAAAVLAAVETEPGRTTDPVRMYMREMGTVDLLTREGEISIAKRIEDGIRDILHAMAYWPGAVELVLKEYNEAVNGERRLSDILSGYLDPESDEIPEVIEVAEDEVIIPELAGAEPAAAKSDDEDDSADEEEAESGPDPEIARIRFTELTERHAALQEALQFGRHSEQAKLALQEMATVFMM
ncbi:MAG: RNA polymerase sigma factor RpoD, partial [Candidatus Saccharibacteria bacterium]|nr:RNA polymerase sigma factor RpoD [Moraxellaceae bacterium]